MESKQDRIDVVRKLIGVEFLEEVPFLHGDFGGMAEYRQPVALARYQVVTDRAGLVIELARCRNEEAPAGQGGAGRPVEPVREKRANTRFAPRHSQRRRDHGVDELPDGGPKNFELKVLFGFKVRKEPALGHAQLARELSDAQSGKPDGAGGAECRVENRASSLFTLGHTEKIERSFYFVKRPGAFCIIVPAATAADRRECRERT